jgi:uncharacterized protein (TIGR02594 family)
MIKDFMLNFPPWLAWWIVEYSKNVKEIPGTGHNDRILHYHSYTKLKVTADEIPWCSAAMCCCFEELGIGSPKSAAARSWLGFGLRLKEFKLGAICVFERGDPNSISGHVAVALAEDDKIITVIGGNQSNAITITKFPKSKLIAYLWPM